MANRHRTCLILLSLYLALALTGCGRASGPAQSLPDSGVVPGWQASAQAFTYNKDTLFQLMDGQAEYFFRYGFEEVAVRTYKDSQGNNLEAEVWRLATTADAYGLFSANDLGNPVLAGKAAGANLQDGAKLVFWQDRYFVLLRPAVPIQNADLIAFAAAISGKLPAGGSPPDLIGHLPPEGKIERSEIFFHEEVTIQNELWLGDNNVLGLSPQTNAVLAKYDLNGETELLLLVEYPDPSSATVAHFALDSGHIEGYQESFANGKLLAAAFGNGAKDQVEKLMAQALLSWMPMK